MCNHSKRNGIACYYCRRKFDNDIVKTKDHAVAKSRGGYDKESNYVDCCFDCNQWKADKPLDVWLKVVEEFLERGRHRIYTKIQLGQIVGNIKKLMANLKGNKKVAVYKPK